VAGVWEESGCHAAHRLQNSLWGSSVVSGRASPSALLISRRGERTEPLFARIRLMHLGPLGPAALPGPTDSSNVGFWQHSPPCTSSWIPGSFALCDATIGQGYVRAVMALGAGHSSAPALARRQQTHAQGSSTATWTLQDSTARADSAAFRLSHVSRGRGRAARQSQPSLFTAWAGAILWLHRTHVQHRWCAIKS